MSFPYCSLWSLISFREIFCYPELLQQNYEFNLYLNSNLSKSFQPKLHMCNREEVNSIYSSPYGTVLQICDWNSIDNTSMF